MTMVSAMIKLGYKKPSMNKKTNLTRSARRRTVCTWVWWAKRRIRNAWWTNWRAWRGKPRNTQMQSMKQRESRRCCRIRIVRSICSKPNLIKTGWRLRKSIRSPSRMLSLSLASVPWNLAPRQKTRRYRSWLIRWDITRQWSVILSKKQSLHPIQVIKDLPVVALSAAVSTLTPAMVRSARSRARHLWKLRPAIRV